MVKIAVECSYCSEVEGIVKHGKSRRGSQRYKCKCCNRTFILDYVHEAYKPGVKEKIVEMAMNSSGLRDTARVLGVGYNTVLRTLKNSPLGR